MYVAGRDRRSRRSASSRVNTNRPWPRTSSTYRPAGLDVGVFIPVADYYAIRNDVQPVFDGTSRLPMR